MDQHFNQYDVVRVVEVLVEKPVEQSTFDMRLPQAGDVATVLEVYSAPFGYELECSDSDGKTIWLGGYSPNDCKLELMWSSE